jgi:hypothetical protein
MTSIIVTAEVDDVAKWEAAFRTRGELFVKQAIQSPVKFSVNVETSEVAVLFETDDIDTFNAVFKSDETHTAMTEDGIRPETVKAVILDREFSF